MKLIISRSNGFVGLYWCSATKQLALDLTSRFGLRLCFKFTEAEEDKIANHMVNHFQEKQRLESLSNVELVNEVANTPGADYEEVIEMMDRLDPEWFNRDENTDQVLSAKVLMEA